jgi:RNA recognition motif-containing protein
MENTRYPSKPPQEPRQSKQLPNRVFVGGLPKKATNETLLKFFLQFGRLTECRIVQDPATQMNKNFAFVAFQHKEDFDCFLALDMLKHKYLNSVLTIKPSQDKDQVEAAKKDEANRKVSLFNIPHQTKVEDLRKKLQVKFGEIEQINQHFYRGYAFVLFKYRESAQTLIQLGTFDFNGVNLEARQFLMKDEVYNQKQTPVQVTSREPSSTKNAWGQPVVHRQQTHGEDTKHQELTNQKYDQRAHSLFGFLGGASAPSHYKNVAGPSVGERENEIQDTRERTRTDLSSLMTTIAALEFKEMGQALSDQKPEAETKTVQGSQAASDKRKDMSSAGSKNESAQSRIKADQEKTLSYLIEEDDDDTRREVSDTAKPDELSSTTISKLASNFEDRAASLQFQPVHEQGKQFSMFVQKSSDMQAGVDRLLFKSDILGDTKMPDTINRTNKQTFGKG